jgi:hypothetical protein
LLQDFLHLVFPILLRNVDGDWHVWEFLSKERKVFPQDLGLLVVYLFGLSLLLSLPINRQSDALDLTEYHVENVFVGFEVLSFEVFLLYLPKKVILDGLHFALKFSEFLNLVI